GAYFAFSFFDSIEIITTMNHFKKVVSGNVIFHSDAFSSRARLCIRVSLLLNPFFFGSGRAGGRFPWCVLLLLGAGFVA
ncbi:MAG: hypothetical protein ACE5DY_06575, partial [Mariprofundaceae bacterium]